MRLDLDTSNGLLPGNTVSSRSKPALAHLPEISDFIDGLLDAVWKVNTQIHDNPELGFGEFKAHDVLTEFVSGRSIGRAGYRWNVKKSAYGMRTAWVASFDTGKPGPVVSFNAEMDALPGIGHACGHNLIAVVSLAGALATAEVAANNDLGGRVVLFGTPAEEGGGGKIRLLNAGAYDDYGVDVSLISHPGITHPTALMGTTAIQNFDVSYHGRAAHAAASPWEGINALDALVLAYNGISVLRQQTLPTDIIQGFISNGGVRPNIIHEYAAGSFAVRAPKKARLETLRPKVNACFRAGAEATGARLEIRDIGAYADLVPNRPLGKSYAQYWNALVDGTLGDGVPGSDNNGAHQERIPLDSELDEKQGLTAASTDQGDISYAMPSISVGFALRSVPVDGTDRPGGGPHTVDFEAAAGTREAFARAMTTAKSLAGTGIDILTVKGFLEEVKKAWKADMEKSQA